MKVKIEYKFLLGDEYPYKAIARFDNGNSTWASSEVDYKTAKGLLIIKLNNMVRDTEPVPEPEEVVI